MLDFNDLKITQLINLAFQEDCVTHDITAKAFIDPNQKGYAEIIVKSPGVWCGHPIAKKICELFPGASKLSYIEKVPEGYFCSLRQTVGIVEGNIQDLLSVERTILNFTQRQSGIATITKSYVESADGNYILDTRKSIPGHRELDKYAVTIGGGKNHRKNLADMALVKNNHIDALNNDFSKLEEIVSKIKLEGKKVEIEVRSIEELKKILNSCSPDIIMLDNFDDVSVQIAVEHLQSKKPEISIEISGGLNHDRIKRLSSIVKNVYFSVGAIFTQVKNLDISFSIHNSLQP